MKYEENILEILSIQPDYIGLIFYNKSPRFYNRKFIPFPEKTQKVGVFVDAQLTEVFQMIDMHYLDVVQLHGHESDDYCHQIKKQFPQIKLWKTIAVDQNFEMQLLSQFDAIDAYLFDTKGKYLGGNGKQFEWHKLLNFNANQAVVLSGGIDANDVERIHSLRESLPQLSVVDINSCFETEPGRKECDKVKKFYSQLNVNQ